MAFKHSINYRRSWHSRNYLPHYTEEGVAQFVTIRLDDSLQKSAFQSIDKKNIRMKIFELEDIGYGNCHLRKPEIAEAVEASLLFLNDKKCLLHAWVIMPNHVHLLLTPIKPYTLTQVIFSFKSYTAKRVNALLGEKGRFWQPDYFDRYIRNEEHFLQVVKYIEENPVKAGLCIKHGDWRYGSAYRRARCPRSGDN